MNALAVQRQLESLVERTLDLNTRSWEAEPAERVTEGLVPQLVGLVREAVAVLDGLVALGDARTDSPAPASSDREYFAELDRLLASDAATHLADLAFMARLELRVRCEALLHPHPGDDVWRRISTCASMRRKLVKSLVAVEQGLCGQAGLKSAMPLVPATETQRALVVRAAYTAFRRNVQAAGAELDVQTSLRRIGVSIAKLVGRDVYEELRIDDRVQLRDLQDRIVAWLRGADGKHPRNGLRLQQDAVAFAGMLVLVNNRVELREHDRRLVDAILAALPPTPASPITPELRALCVPLAGRDDAFDGLLAVEPACTVGALAAALHQQRIEFSTDPRPEAPAPEPAPITPVEGANLAAEAAAK